MVFDCGYEGAQVHRSPHIEPGDEEEEERISGRAVGNVKRSLIEARADWMDIAVG